MFSLRSPWALQCSTSSRGYRSLPPRTAHQPAALNWRTLRANGSRECAPDDRLREAIHLAAQRKNGLLRRFRLRSLSYGGQVAPRNDVASGRESAIPRRNAPELCINSFALKESRAWGMPGVDAPAASCVMKTNTRVSHHRSTGIARHSRTQWFYGLLRALPGDQALLSPSPALLLADLTPTLGRQNHTTSPYASAPFVTRAARVHRIPPRVRNVRNAPQTRRDRIAIVLILPR
jgi:hypothetical protein